MSKVVVMGASGRVGAAISDRLAGRFQVRRVVRGADDDMESLVDRAVEDSSVLVNAAGVAHVDRVDDGTLDRLRAGNVELPWALARRALDVGAAFVHVSSSKAATPDRSPYAASKSDGEQRLAGEFGEAFRSAGLSLTVIRPPALLFPPLDAGRVSKLRFLRRWPSALVPPLRLPVLAPSAFLDAVELLVATAVAGTAPPGYHVREFARSEWGTLRDVHAALRTSPAA